MYPELLEKLISSLSKLPGVGSKTAERYVFNLLTWPKDDMDSFCDNLNNISSIKYCENCGFLTTDKLCKICTSTKREKDKLMVVSFPQDVVAVEKTNGYDGLYHILNGVISTSKGTYPEDLNIPTLLKRVDRIKEIIIATPFTIDGEMTALYLAKLLKDKVTNITRLAQGLPMGASLDYTDEFTLLNAMNNRQKIKENTY